MHYETCAMTDCPTCMPIKTHAAKIKMEFANSSSTSPSAPAIGSVEFVTMHSEDYHVMFLHRVKIESAADADWRSLVNDGHRKKMIQRLFVSQVKITPMLTAGFSVEALTSCMTPEYLKEREEDVKSLAKRIEEELFRKANAKDEYYTILAQKIFKLNQAASQSSYSLVVVMQNTYRRLKQRRKVPRPFCLRL